MRAFDTNKEDEEHKALRQTFEILKATVVSRRNAVVILRASATIATERLQHEERILKKDEVELKQLHKILHFDEQ